MSAYNLLSNCMKEKCFNNNVDKNNNLYCNATPPENKSLSLAAELLFCFSLDHRSQSVQFQTCSSRESLYKMGMYDKHSLQSFYRLWHIQCTIIVTLIAITLARLVIRCDINGGKSETLKMWLRYVSEFVVISVPVIVSVNVASSYVELIAPFACLIFIFIIWRKKCWQLAAKKDYEFGLRPALFTLIRSSINILTAVCILAIDFESFPKEFRKSRRYGVGLMDVGIGVFVFSMGLVASKPRKFSDLRKFVLTVGCLLVLGLARTLVIAAIDYHQDEHEYGTHLNAFFTLGLTKLFATCFGLLVKCNEHLLMLGVVVLLSHETILQCGVWKYVMDPDIKRTNFINSNREGLYSLPGFVALYLLSQYLGTWLQSKDILNFEEIKNKLKSLLLTSVTLWLLAISSIFIIGIARVTCNFGYVVWILAMSVTIFTYYLFVFDIVLDTLLPASNETNNLNLTDITAGKLLVDSRNSKIPLVVEAVNFNGLTFFLLANILTGCTNMYFATDEKSNFESVIILFIYMFITTTFVFILYRYKIRIA